MGITRTRRPALDSLVPSLRKYLSVEGYRREGSFSFLSAFRRDYKHCLEYTKRSLVKRQRFDAFGGRRKEFPRRMDVERIKSPGVEST